MHNTQQADQLSLPLPDAVEGLKDRPEAKNLVNIYAAVWIVIDKRKARQAPPPTVQAAATSKKKRGRR